MTDLAGSAAPGTRRGPDELPGPQHVPAARRGRTWMIVGGGMARSRPAGGAGRRAARGVRTSRRCRASRWAGGVEAVHCASGRELRTGVAVVNSDPFRMRDLVGAALPTSWNAGGGLPADRDDVQGEHGAEGASLPLPARGPGPVRLDDPSLTRRGRGDGVPDSQLRRRRGGAPAGSRPSSGTSTPRWTPRCETYRAPQLRALRAVGTAHPGGNDLGGGGGALRPAPPVDLYRFAPDQ